MNLPAWTCDTETMKRDMEKHGYCLFKEALTPEQLSESTELSIDQVRRGIEWLRLKEFANVIESSKVTVSL